MKGEATAAGIAKRREKAWNSARLWQSLYDDAYAYAIPGRRPARGRHGSTKGEDRSLELFDSTAANMVFQSAAQMRDDIAPPGAPLARLGINRLARRVLLAQRGQEALDQVMAVHADLSDAANMVFSGTSGFPTALLEACLDCHIGTGALLAMKGDVFQPIRWAAIPQDELAVEMDVFGRETLIAWKQEHSKLAIRNAFPGARFDADFMKDWDKTSADEMEFEQVWVRREDAGWRFLVYVTGKKGAAAKDPAPVLDEVTATCPVVLMHYNRVPGEDRGRGPLLNMLAAIRTANKVMDLQLRAASIDLLGIWLYEPNDFNPDTAPLEPGAFWPGNTGGIMGESVKRLDTRGDRSDLAANLMGDLRQQITQGFQRQPAMPDGKSPRSATEFMIRDKEQMRAYRGAYGRLVEDFVPKVFWRAVEVVQEVWGLHRNFRIDRMMTQLEVLSPLAVSMRLATYQPTVEYMQVAAQLMAMPPDVELFAEREELLTDMGYDAGVRPEYLVNSEERAAKLQQRMAGQAMAALAQQAAAAPPPEPAPVGAPA